MLGIEVEAPLAISRGLMQRGYLALPAGVTGFEVLALTPSLTIYEASTAWFSGRFDRDFQSWAEGGWSGG